MIFRYCYSNMKAWGYFPFREGHSLPMKCTGPLPVSRRLLANFKVEAEPDVCVHVRAQIVEVQRSHARIAGVVPIPETDRNALTDSHYSCFTGCAPSRWDLIHPPSNLPTSSIFSIHRVYFF